MKVGFLTITKDERLSPTATEFVAKAVRVLSEHAYFTACCLQISAEEDGKRAFDYLSNRCDALVVTGDTAGFIKEMAQVYEFAPSQTLEIGGILCALCDRPDERFLTDVVIPMLNSRCKTYYATAVFKTFGKTESELRTLLKEYIKGRNRIVFSFYPFLSECDVHVRYSNKTATAAVTETLCAVAERLKDCLYARRETDLATEAARLLMERGKRLCVAESFTGGAITAALVHAPGMSTCLQEGIVCYTDASKRARLGVDSQIIEQYGAVSIETVYEMAAGLLVKGDCDLVVATTGNAGPTSEKPGENGLCFIAVGDAHGIHIYKYQFEGTRADVIESGKKAALFLLCQKLNGEPLQARQPDVKNQKGE